MSVNDPWAVLDLSPGASAAEARAARRRLAKQLHPDVLGGRSSDEAAELADRMARVNQAVAEIERREPAARDRQERPIMAQQADDSFSVDCLPVDAFEALFLAAYGLGDILVADEPYLLELYLLEPAPCFCRLTLVPEAGGSIVTVDLSPAADRLHAPAPAEVIEVLVAELNALVPG